MEKLRFKLTSAKVEVEFEDELGNFLSASQQVNVARKAIIARRQL